ncbi:BrnT family toxin [Amorphus sp. 3PC139-8]
MTTPQPITFDDAKDTVNRERHGMSLSEAARFDFETAYVRVDDRHDYGERREIAIGLIGRRLHVLVFTMRDETVRAISLRKANLREIKLYDQARP